MSEDGKRDEDVTGYEDGQTVSYNEDRVEDSLEFCKDIKIYRDHDEEARRNGAALGEHARIEFENKRMRANRIEQMNQYAYQNLEVVQKDMDEEEDEKGFFLREVLKDLVYVSICVVISFVVSFLFTHYVAHHSKVDGSSMLPALRDDDYLVVERVSYYFHKPRRYDVVVFPMEDEVNLIKRVIGLPGESVQIKDGFVYIGGKKLKDDYGTQPMVDAGMAEDVVRLGKDEYFVLGDNRNFSMDSRRENVGTVKEDEILGRAWFRFYPFDAMGAIK